jgi:hypothetical protein
MVKILVVQMRYQHLRLENQVEHPPTLVSHFHSSDLEGRRKNFLMSVPQPRPSVFSSK